MVTTLNRSTIKFLLGGGLIVLALITGAAYGHADGSYGSGSYGSCQYNACGISLNSTATVSVDITPASGTVCTVNGDTVSVLTDSSTGYTLQLADADTVNNLAGATHGGNITATTGSTSTPIALAANKWGYRVDGIAGFGTGPTTALSNGSVPVATFAAVPLSSATPDTIATSTGPADPAADTTVWYGACADTSLPSDSYSDGIVYTAIVN